MRLKLAIDLPVALAALADHRPQELFPAHFQLLHSTAEFALEYWRGIAQGTIPLQDGRRITPRTGAYARSLQMEQAGELAYELYSAHPRSRWFDVDLPERDLHEILLATSPKAKVSKGGWRYMFIPFRWNAPGAAGGRDMSPRVYEAAKALAPSRVVRPGKYAWGGKLGHAAARRLGDPPAPSGLPLRGNLYRFATAGGGAQYTNFRTLSERNPPGSWILPPRPAYNIVPTVRDRAAAFWAESVDEARRLDGEHLTRLIGGPP